MDWHLALDGVGWAGWGVALLVAWWTWRQPTRGGLATDVRHEQVPPQSFALVQRAMLLNATGSLDSVRTMTGPPPEQIVCAAGTYVWDRDSVSDHLVYRLTVSR